MIIINARYFYAIDSKPLPTGPLYFDSISVRSRKIGKLLTSATSPSLINPLSGENQNHRISVAQYGKCAIRYHGKKIEVRVATLPTVHGESLVLSILATNAALPHDAINLSQENEKRVARLARKTHGVFLVVGPTGSGKTTTLHAALNTLNDTDRKIWTVENPVEITQPGLQQVQIRPKIGFDFSSALRAFLRADPDVVMIG